MTVTAVQLRRLPGLLNSGGLLDFEESGMDGRHPPLWRLVAFDRPEICQGGMSWCLRKKMCGFVEFAD